MYALERSQPDILSYRTSPSHRAIPASGSPTKHGRTISNARTRKTLSFQVSTTPPISSSSPPSDRTSHFLSPSLSTLRLPFSVLSLNSSLTGTPRSLFFIRYDLFGCTIASPWANNQSPASALAQIRTDEHSIRQFRVLGPLTNFEVFAEVFECPVGSKVNPGERCELW
jgi:hypothetical protein